ncbi:MAG: hypothetical protein JNM78_10825 [Cyclobacteriaceae bacterium]|nr:hypothetical protein [Cyclobacteriaceae bacterium]
MANGNFTIGARSQDITVLPEDITTEHDGLRSFIKVFLRLKLKLNEGTKITSFDFINIHTTLLLLNGNIQLSSTTTPCAIKLFDKEVETGIWVKFYMDDRSIFAAQKYRDGGDLKLRIDLTFTALRKKVLNLNDNETLWGIERVENFTGEVQLVVPKSYWVEKLLPALGYPGFKLIEIPLTHLLLNEAYDNIISEFNKAESYFNKGDYNACIAHCRNTMDTLKENLKNLKNGIESKTAFNWLQEIDTITLTWIDTVNKSLSAIASKTHHGGLKKDFTRVEAESIYLVTLGLMNFVGQASSDYSAD